MAFTWRSENNSVELLLSFHLYMDSGTLNSGSQANAYLLSLLPHTCDCYLDQHQIIFWVLGPDHCFLDGPWMLIEMFVHNAYSRVLRESNSNLGFRINHFDDSFCLGVMPSEVLPIRKELGFLGDVSSPWTRLRGHGRLILDSSQSISSPQHILQS